MNHRNYEDTKLIPELTKWKALNGDDFSVEEWIGSYHSPELMIGFAEYFYPQFEERLGGVFFYYGHAKEDYDLINVRIKQNLEQRFNNDMIRYQMLENHRHIWDFIATPDNQDKITFEQISFLSSLLVEIWGLKLKNDFPHLDIHIETSPVDKDNLVETNITFWVE